MSALNLSAFLSFAVLVVGPLLVELTHFQPLF